MKESLRCPPQKRAEREREPPDREAAQMESPVLAARGMTAAAFGNRALLSLLRSGHLQRKARVSQPGDPLEHEADRASEAVVAGAEPVRPVRSAPPNGVQRMPTEDQQLAAALGLESEEGRVGADPPPPPDESSRRSSASIAGTLYGGHSLDERTRESMESQFGESFSDVRIHTGSTAANTADTLHSRAFTIGSDIVFAEGEYAPDTTEGRRLLAHELAHVVQQRQPIGPIAGEKEAERDAHEAAHEVAYGGTPTVRERAVPGTVQKEALIPVWEGSSFPGLVSLFAMRPQFGPELVVELTGDAALAVQDAAGFEHGGASGNDTLNVHIAFIGSVSGTKTITNNRWQQIVPKLIPAAAPGPAPAPEKPPPPPPRKTPPKSAPKPKAAPSPVPQPVEPQPAEPQPAEPQPKEPQPAAEPAAAKTQQVPSGKLREALASDPGKVPEAAAKLTDQEMAALTNEDRIQTIDAIARRGTATDLATLMRLLRTTPDADAGALNDAIEADSGKLLRDFYPKIGVNGMVQISFATMDLGARRTDRPVYSLLDLPQTTNPQLNLANLFRSAPPDPTEIVYVGDKSTQPTWLKGARYWKDAKGNTNFMSPELGLATWDLNGKRLNLPPPGYYEAARAVRGSMYLAQTGGRRYVEGKGWLDEAGWKAHLQEVAAAYTVNQGREFANLKGFQEEWDKTQANAAPAPKYLSHLLGGRSTDDPSRIVDRTAKDIDIGRNEILKARTPEELETALRYATGITRYGEYQFGQYREDVYLGGERTITGIKVTAAAATAYVSAPVLLTSGGAMISLKGAAIGVGAGGAFSATRQGVEIWQGTRTQFSVDEVKQGMIAGGIVGFFPVAAPGMVGWGVASGADEFSQGHYGTGAFDMGTAMLPFAVKGAPPAWQYARPRIAAGFMRLSIGAETGMGRGVYPGGIPVEPQIVLVDTAGRPVSRVTGRPSTVSESPGTTVASETPTNTRTNPNVVDPIDAAFAPDAPFQVGPLRQLNRVRTTGSGRQLISLDDVQLTAEQRAAAKQVHGQKMAEAQRVAWENASDPQDVAEVSRLWNEGTPQSRDQARALAREAFNRQRARYWRAVRSNTGLKGAFEAAGMRFKGGKTSAPVYELSDGTVARMTLEHSTRLTDNPTRALSGDNLQFVLGDENSFYLEALRAEGW